MLRGVVVGGLVEKFSGIAQDNKTVGKAFGDPKLALVVCGKNLTYPLAKCFAAFSEVYCYIKYFALHHTHQFALGLLNLVVQTAQDIFCAATMVVLDEVRGSADGTLKFGLVVTFEEKPRSSPNSLGSMRMMSGIMSAVIFILLFYCVMQGFGEQVSTARPSK